ncbi:MAG: hypothetical protein NWQ43_12240, partial [Dolichospermum sp.]|nr:hypothetical protein [Dolichospermum sp.]
MQNSPDIKRWQSIIAFLLVTVLFGSLPPVTKQVVASLTPSVQLAVRYLFAVLFLMPWIAKISFNLAPVKAWKNHLKSYLTNKPKAYDINIFSEDVIQNSLIIDSKLLRDGFVLGILTFGIHICLSFGVKTISANRTSFLFGLCIIFVTLLDLVYRNRFSLRFFLSAILAFSGSYLMSWEQSSEPLIGTLWILGAVFCEAMLLIILEDIASSHSPMNLSIVRLGVATFLALSFGISELPSQLT